MAPEVFDAVDVVVLVGEQFAVVDAKDSGAPLNVPNDYKGKNVKVMYPDIPWRKAPEAAPAEVAPTNG